MTQQHKRQSETKMVPVPMCLSIAGTSEAMKFSPLPTPTISGLSLRTA